MIGSAAGSAAGAELLKSAGVSVKSARVVGRNLASSVALPRSSSTSVLRFALTESLSLLRRFISRKPPTSTPASNAAPTTETTAVAHTGNDASDWLSEPPGSAPELDFVGIGSDGHRALDPVQLYVLLHVVPAGRYWSGGHDVRLPSHTSSTSQRPATGRHTAPCALTAFAGQFALEPVHLASFSQRSAAGAQMVDDGLNESAGQLAPVPVQYSAASQTPAASRQTVVDGFIVLPGHAADEPVHLASFSQTPDAGEQTVADGLNESAGQVALDPVQYSALSQSPAAARQTVPDALNVPVAVSQHTPDVHDGASFVALQSSEHPMP
jgi:hypothetical protein